MGALLLNRTGNSSGGKRIRTWGDQILRRTGVQRHNLARFLLGGDWGYFLLVVSVFRDSNRGVTAGDGNSGGCDF